MELPALSSAMKRIRIRCSRISRKSEILILICGYRRTHMNPHLNTHLQSNPLHKEKERALLLEFWKQMNEDPPAGTNSEAKAYASDLSKAVALERALRKVLASRYAPYPFSESRVRVPLYRCKSVFKNSHLDLISRAIEL